MARGLRSARIQAGAVQLDEQALLERAAGDPHRIQALDLAEDGLGLVQV